MLPVLQSIPKELDFNLLNHDYLVSSKQPVYCPRSTLNQSATMFFHRIVHKYAIVAAIAAGMILLIAGCANRETNQGKQRKPMKFPVEVATVTSRDAQLVVQAVGSVEAFEIVQVTVRVPGVVHKVRFREGEYVNAGAQLVEIEPDRYTLSLQSAEAALERAKASLREAQSGLTRRIDIGERNPGFVSTEDLENWQTRVLSLQADSAQAAVNLDLAKLNLRDAYVPAPVSGTMQSRTVKTGQYVQAGTVIATMVRRDPLLLKFAVPDQEAQRLRTGQIATFSTRDSRETYEARITAVTDFADPATRMITVTAEVTDPRRSELHPGAFAEVTVSMGESTPLPVIPQLCIRPSERGFLAFVIEDSIAHERVLTLGLRTDDGNVEVYNGVEAGETIVVRGAEALAEGAVVRIIKGGKSDSTAAKPGAKK